MRHGERRRHTGTLPNDTRPGGRLRRFRRDRRGFAGAEAALLALILCGICIVAGGILRKAALTAATNLNNELAGSK